MSWIHLSCMACHAMHAMATSLPLPLFLFLPHNNRQPVSFEPNRTAKPQLK